MPRFHYALQPALDVALADERRAGAVAAQAAVAIHAERRALAVLDGELKDIRLALAASVAGPRRVACWLDVAAHTAALGTLRAIRQSSLGVADREFAKARAAHEILWRRTAAFVRHRERRYEAFSAECERRDADELDEMNALRRQAG